MLRYMLYQHAAVFFRLQQDPPVRTSFRCSYMLLQGRNEEGKRETISLAPNRYGSAK